jgi:hypothetical protein
VAAFTGLTALRMVPDRNDWDDFREPAPLKVALVQRVVACVAELPLLRLIDVGETIIEALVSARADAPDAWRGFPRTPTRGERIVSAASGKRTRWSSDNYACHVS